MTSVFNKILIPTDFSDYSRKTIECGREFADLGAEEIVLLHIGLYDPFILSLARMSVDEYVEKIKEKAENELKELAGIVEEKGLKVRTIFLATYTDPAEEIVRISEEEGVDLILIGSKGHGWLKAKLIGGTSESVARLSKVPVLITKFQVEEKDGEKYCRLTFERLLDRVLFTFDKPEISEKALKILEEFSRVGKVFLVHVVEKRNESEIEEEIREYGDFFDGIANAEWKVLWGNPVNEILNYARETKSSLIVVGKKERKLGKVADSLLRHSEIPIMILNK
ncbi:Universal stress protein UspA-related nucleotide-binding protein [Archaeoglobus sulfaticallidus PM70-1]|uniref:Universal stress protein UspA-related nucleotide-binding protein n=1 Tax=Archaeoglobus sulfaticallidus PM70-1 TaxID=387631 RepID=N0BJT9_9EURY|nr:universal stress protein [Archaeoglobus sulfaticallidus]AGK60766.1 Universal stress protein UspA-related nucleotide-binding protein [Archaeoglobus sulfaticallidus PM70-1]